MLKTKPEDSISINAIKYGLKLNNDLLLNKHFILKFVNFLLFSFYVQGYKDHTNYINTQHS